MYLIMNNSPHCALSIDYEENTKFLGLQIHKHLNWNNSIHQMILKVSGACYTVKLKFHIGILNTLESLYFAFFSSIIR